jgi:hypothetical protein
LEDHAAFSPKCKFSRVSNCQFFKKLPGKKSALGKITQATRIRISIPKGQKIQRVEQLYDKFPDFLTFGNGPSDSSHMHMEAKKGPPKKLNQTPTKSPKEIPKIPASPTTRTHFKGFQKIRIIDFPTSSQ